MAANNALERDVVVSSRVRLARNYKDIPFAPSMNREWAQETIRRAADALARRPETYQLIRMENLTDAQRRALTLVDNQTTMMTGWDADMLAYELDVLAQDFDMVELGFSDFGEGATDIIEEEGEPKRKVVTCPHCGETFEA